MSDLKELQNKKKDLILKLDEDEIESYILSLTQKYYTYLIKGDVSGIGNVIESLDYMVDIYEFRYSDISDYINYCLLISSNKIFKKVFDLKCRLWIPSEKSISSEVGFNSFSYSLEKSRKRIINEESNIKEVYDMILELDDVPEEVIDKMTKLYNSFKIFNYGGEL